MIYVLFLILSARVGDLGFVFHPLCSWSGIMPRKRSRARRLLEESSSDDDESLILSAARIVQAFSNEKGRHGGSVKGHKVLYRDREGGHDRMYQDYLADNPTYGPEIFRRRFLLL